MTRTPLGIIRKLVYSNLYFIATLIWQKYVIIFFGKILWKVLFGRLGVDDRLIKKKGRFGLALTLDRQKHEHGNGPSGCVKVTSSSE
jgi:hypothetical protein